MKTQIFSTLFLFVTLLIFSTLLLSACNKNKGQSFIPGTYVNHAGGNYSVADDTLTIEHSGGSNYLIHRSTGFNLIRNGKKGKREHETEQWNTVYNKENGSLTETRKGKTITFYPEANKLMVGNREYQKLN